MVQLNQSSASSLSWQDACAAKRVECYERIPLAWRIDEATLESLKDVKNVLSVPGKLGILTDKEIEITELDHVEGLLQQLANGAWSSEEVTVAFCKRAAIAQQLTNCLTETFFEEAIARAKELDIARAQDGPVGPLHGLPISVKDQFKIAGRETNMGWAAWLGLHSDENSTIVNSLLQAGAVIHTRTSLSQGAWFSEGDNHVYGRTDNPYNRDLVPGGSSAGEGALVAMRGSPLGVGTDIGGSVRIPSAFCGLYGLRPTARRFPYGKALNSLMGQEAVESVLGPMTPDLSGCVAFTKGVLETEPWNEDPSTIPLPWREELYKLTHKGGPTAKMCFAYYDYDGITQVLPPVKRAMQIAVDGLKAAGHQVISWKPVDYHKADEMIKKIFDADGGEDLRVTTAKTSEPILPQVVVNSLPGLSVWELHQVNQEKAAYREAFVKQWMQTATQTSTGRPIDAIICPIAPYPPLPHRKTFHFAYTSVYNLLDVPAIAIPLTHVDPTLDQLDPSAVPRTEVDVKIRDLYDPEALAGAPIAVQLVGRRFQEEELLGLTEIVRTVVGAK